MKSATVVIGANYGDEGKGRIVVFSHIGSGTLAGAGTYLAKHFVCNPILYWEERRRLEEFGLTPTISADPRCYVTTAYDMIVNQAVEDARGDARHGSVGVGFGETIERNRYPAFRLLVGDLTDHELIRRKIQLIRDRWIPVRSRQLGLPEFDAGVSWYGDEAMEKIAKATIAFGETIGVGGLELIAGRPIIFEGAQGVALDMDGPNFPHVTRSNTGLTNVIPIAKALGIALDVIYATRPFLTKHGAGPLPNEYQPNPPIRDETNLPHAYQGKFRFAMLDVDDLRARVATDQKLARAGDKMSYALTWLDAVGQDTLLSWAKKLERLRFYSTGPKRNEMMEIVR